MAQEKRPAALFGGEDEPAAALQDTADAPALAPAEEHIAAPAIPRRDNSDTVVIGCKHPNGYQLRLFRETTVVEQQRDGTTKDVVVYQQTDDKPIRLNGAAFNYGAMKLGIERDFTVSNGVAFTPGVPRWFWEEWKKQHHSLPALVNGMIYAAADEADLRAFARERKDQRSGLEPIDQNNPGLTTGMTAGDQRIERGDRT